MAWQVHADTKAALSARAVCWLSKPFILCLLLAPSIYWLTGVSALQADELMFMKFGLSSLAFVWAYSTWIWENAPYRCLR